MQRQRHSGKLVCMQKDIDWHLKQIYSVNEREQESEECNILMDPPESGLQFDMSELQLKVVKRVVHRVRVSSAPEPSSTYFLLYRSCPKLLLLKDSRVLWMKSSGKISEERRVAEDCGDQGEKLHPDRPVLLLFMLCDDARIFSVQFPTGCAPIWWSTPSSTHHSDLRHFRNARPSAAHRCDETDHRGGQVRTSPTCHHYGWDVTEFQGHYWGCVQRHQ